MKIINIVLRKIILFCVVLFSFGMSWNSIDSLGAPKTFISQESGLSLAPMLERVMPSVISIDIEGNNFMRKSRLPHQFQPFFDNRSPFCQRNSPFRNSPLCGINPNSQHIRQKFHALGSGVIINAAKGYAVTNNHVVEHANKIHVQLSDGRRYKAVIIGKDAHSDIALIQLKNANNLRQIKIADSDSLRVGDYTVAIGNPYGLGETVTSGIISALGRSGLNIERYENFIQTDAAINRGNSGGALVNLSGELIGINTAILAPDGGNIGIGFAIPGNMVKNLTSQMVQFGHVRRGELGIVGMELNSDLASIMKVNIQRGAFVSQVLPNSSAALAGMQAGDVITLLNQKPISSFASLRAQIGSLPVTTKMELGIFRDSKLRSIVVELKHSIKHNLNARNHYIGMEGVILTNYTLNGKHVIKVEDVKINTKAYRIGLKKNDIILSVNQKLFTSTDDLKKFLNTKPNMLVFNIKRGDTNIYLVTDNE